MGPIQTTIGFELVDSELRIAVLHARFGKLRLDQSLQISGFESLSEENKRSAIAGFLKKYRLTHAKAFLTLPGRMGLIRQSELPVEISDRIRSSLALQIESLSPWAADEIYWDCAADPPAKGARTVRVTTAIIPRSVLDPWLVLFKSAGLPLSGAALSSLAHVHAAATMWQKASSDVLLSCESSSLEGVVVRDGAVAAFSSDDQPDSSWPNDAATVLGRSLALCKLKPTDDARVVVFGRNASAVRTGEALSLPIENAEQAVASSFGPVSAALLGLRKSAFSLNLIPPADRFRPSHLQMLPTYALLAFVLLLGAALVLKTPYQWNQYAAELDSEIEKLRPEVDAVSAQEAEFARLSGDYQALKGRLEVRDVNLEAMRELARILPADCWLSSYVSQGRNLTLSGFAQSASVIQKVLEESPLFEEVQFGSSVTRDVSGKDRFTLKAVMAAVAP